MWLINTKTLQMHQFGDDEVPEYAILSHTWGDEELTFRELSEEKSCHKKGYQKVKRCCEVSLKDGFEWLWADTCCINKASSAELSEAINSMFAWYQDSAICYAYLSDVPTESSVWPSLAGETFDSRDCFHRSRWFTRGWTLQELIAPQSVQFFAADWTWIGSKSVLKQQLAHITRIDEKVFANEGFSQYSVAYRMSWAASRKTSRIEDRAYSLLGIFQVNMPLLYGEGEKAFVRLQEEILKVEEDYTLFAWPFAVSVRGALGESVQGDDVWRPSLLARDLSNFEPPAHSPLLFARLTSIPVENCRFDESRIQHLLADLTEDDTPPTLTGRGLRICLPLTTLDDTTLLASTYCMIEPTKQLICLSLSRIRHGGNVFRRHLTEEYGVYLVNPTLHKFRRYMIYVDHPSVLRSPKLLRTEEGAHVYQLSLTAVDSAAKLLFGGCMSKAETLLVTLYNKSEQLLGWRHIVTFESASWLATIFRIHNQWERAQELHVHMMRASEQMSGQTALRTLMCSVNYAIGLMALSCHCSAEDLLYALTERFDTHVGKLHSSTLHVMALRAINLLTWFELELGKSPGSEDNLRRLQRSKEYCEEVFARLGIFLLYVFFNLQRQPRDLEGTRVDPETRASCQNIFVQMASIYLADTNVSGIVLDVGAGSVEERNPELALHMLRVMLELSQRVPVDTCLKFILKRLVENETEHPDRVSPSLFWARLQKRLRMLSLELLGPRWLPEKKELILNSSFPTKNDQMALILRPAGHVVKYRWTLDDVNLYIDLALELGETEGFDVGRELQSGSSWMALCFEALNNIIMPHIKSNAVSLI